MEFVFYIVVIIFSLIFIVYSIKVYYKSKSEILSKLQNGICPNCGAISDEKGEVIEYKVLNSGGCSGVSDVLYTCNQCSKSYFVQEKIGSCCR